MLTDVNIILVTEEETKEDLMLGIEFKRSDPVAIGNIHACIIHLVLSYPYMLFHFYDVTN